MLHDLREKFAGRGFEILGIAFVEGDDKGRRWLEDYAKQKQLTWPQVPAGEDWFGAPYDAYDAGHLPFYLILDRNGKIVDADVRDREKLEALIEKLLEKSARGPEAALRGTR